MMSKGCAITPSTRYLGSVKSSGSVIGYPGISYLKAMFVESESTGHLEFWTVTSLRSHGQTHVVQHHGSAAGLESSTCSCKVGVITLQMAKNKMGFTGDTSPYLKLDPGPTLIG